MNIPDTAALIKYQQLLNNDRPPETFINIDWAKPVDKIINKFLGKWLHRYIFIAPNIKKLRSIIRKAKQATTI